MSRVHVLPQTLINQIAAGEVIVRMASVVKELVENSIDADARRIEVALSNEARDLDVTDDGTGMDRSDAEMALQRHATSKIRSVEDLFALRTRGFRGEALASIAAVSRLELRTRLRGTQSGTRIVVEGGTIERIEPVGCPEGTRFQVRELFYNTPARRKFLKSPGAEAQAVATVLTRQALAVPAVGVWFTRNGEEVLALAEGQSAADRFSALMGSAVAESPVPVAGERHGIRVTGHVAPATSSRPDRRLQYLFVNGRPFSSRALTASFEQAYHGFLMVGRHPIGALFIEVDPGDVDFNVHPTKEEVRFRDERAVAGALYNAVNDAVMRGAARGVTVGLGGSPAVAPSDATDAQPESSAPAADDDAPRREAPPAFFTSPTVLARRGFDGSSRADQVDWVAAAARFAFAGSVGSPGTPRARAAAPARHADDSVISAGPGEAPDEEFWGRPFEPEALGQVANKYLVARFGEDLLLVDQHAAHERLVFLELERRQAAVEAQTLLVPVVVEVPGALTELMAAAVEPLGALGFEVESFGARSWAVRSVPADLREFDVASFLLELVGEFESSGRAPDAGIWRERVLIRAACHGAVRAGQALPMAQISELLRQMRRERLSFTCPHGRPTIVRLTLAELDRWFKRVI